MRDSEYNSVKVTNEKNNYDVEFTKAQDVEYSFQNENVNPIKDELNDNSAVNDDSQKSEEKKKTEKKESEIKQEDIEKANEAIESSTSSSVASSSASASASASAGATAAAGSVSGAVVGAISVSVAVVGAAVGINVLVEPEPVAEYATFIESEITSDSIGFSFSMPSALLKYEEPEEGSDKESSKSVSVKLQNSKGYLKTQYLQEYEEPDEYTAVFHTILSGLDPDTGYELTIQLEDSNLSAPTVLAVRVFTTLSGKVEPATEFKFTSLEAERESVGFIFTVNDEAIKYNRDTKTADTVTVEITNDELQYTDSLTIERLEEVDESHVSGSGVFESLTAGTEYVISVSVSGESGYKQLGDTLIKTLDAPASGFSGLEITPSVISADFSFVVNPEYVGYQEGVSTPNIVVEASIGSEVKSQTTVESFLLEDDVLKCSGTITDLEGATEYALTVFYIHEDEVREQLGESETFTTIDESTGFSFLKDQFITKFNSITFVFEIKESIVKLSEETSNISAVVTYEEEQIRTISISSFEPSSTSGLLVGSATVSELDPGKSYDITIYADNDELGNTSKKTKSITIAPLDTSNEGEVSFNFYIDDKYIGYEEGSSNLPNLSASAELDGTEVSSTRITTFAMDSDFNALKVSGTITDLLGSTTYMLRFYFTNGDEVEFLGSKEFTTAKDIPTFEFADDEFRIELDYISAFFYIKPGEVVQGETVEVETSSGIEEKTTTNIFINIADASGYQETSNIYYEDFSSTYDGKQLFARYVFSELTPNTTYSIYVTSEIDGSDPITLGSVEKTTSDYEYGFVFKNASVTDSSITVRFLINASEVDYNEGVSNIYASITEQYGSDTQSFNVIEFDFQEVEGKAVGVYTFEELEPGTGYDVSIFKEGLTYGTDTFFTVAPLEPNFSFGDINPTTDGATIYFNISAAYLDFDENDPTTAMRKLTAQISGGSEDPLTVSCVSLTVQSGDTLIGYFSPSGLTSETTYYVNVYVDGLEDPINDNPESFTTERIVPAFNGVNINDRASFFNREIELQLDFTDDPDNPEFEYLAIQFYATDYEEEDKEYLWSPITLESTTETQTITVPEDADWGIGDIKSYGIIQNQDAEIYGGNITFTNGDPDGQVTGLNSDYLIAIDASSGGFTLPVQLFYTDDYDKLMSFYVKLCPTDGATPSVSAGANKEEDYQNLTYTDNDATSVITYIQNAGADGAPFDIKIYHFDDQENPLWKSDSNNPVYIRVAETNIVYGGSLLSTDLSEDSSTSVQFSLAYVAPLQTPSSPVIQFVDSSDPALTYSYDFNFENYPTIDMTHPSTSTGSAIDDYASLKGAFGGHTFTVYIKYYNGTEYISKQIQTGVSFTFA